MSSSLFIVHSLSCVWLFATPWTAARQASLSSATPRSLLRLMSFESMMPSNHLVLCCPLLLLPSIFPNIRVFSEESVFASGGQSIGASASSSVFPMSIQELISFRVDWFDLAVQGALKSLLQHHSLKASILWHSAFFILQPSHTYINYTEYTEVFKNKISTV